MRPEALRHVSVFYPDLHNIDFAQVWPALRESGATVLHTTLAWSLVEPEPGRFDFSCYETVFREIAQAGLRFIIALDSSGRLIIPPNRLVDDPHQLRPSLPGWIVGEISTDVLERDFYGNHGENLDVFDTAHLPLLNRFYTESLAFLKNTLGDRIYAILPAITFELEIKFGQTGFRWRSFSENAQRAFDQFLDAAGEPRLPLPVSDFNNNLIESTPRYQRHFALMMAFRETGLVDYLRPLCRMIRDGGFATIGYFGQFFSFIDAVYATGVIERTQELFDIVCVDFNFYDGARLQPDAWVVPSLVDFARNLGYRTLQIGLYLERYRDLETNKLDTSIFQVVRQTLDHIADAPEIIGLELGGVELVDLPEVAALGGGSAAGFALGQALPTPAPDAIRIAILASFDTHYLWHGDFSCNRDHLHDLLKETFRLLCTSETFAVSILSARLVEQGRQSLAGFDAVFLPHALAIGDALLARLVDAKYSGVKIIQDVASGNFTPDGQVRPLDRLFSLWGLNGMQWFTEPGRFRHGDTVLTIDAGAGPERERYFSYVRMSTARHGVIRLPELGFDKAGLIAESGNALSFGFLPQLCGSGPGKSFWETLFLETIENFVRRR